METIYNKLTELIEAGETVAVATIINVRGSVPREVGAKMIIHPLGRHVGTVGGGCGEADVIRVGLSVLQNGEPATVRIDLTDDVSMQTLGVCGGILDVYVERVSPATIPGLSSVAERTAALRDSMQERRPTALVTVVQGRQIGRQAVVWLDRPPLGELGLGEGEAQAIADARAALRGRQHCLLSYGGEALGGTAMPRAIEGSAQLEGTSLTRLFVEVQRRAPELLIVGGGHIALPLAQMADLCDFAVTVLDDRPLYANRERFPTTRRAIAGPLRETVRNLPLDQDSFVVLVTRGHSHDVECLLEVLDRPVAYIGMIGSQRRVEAVFKLLEVEQGIDPTKFDRVYAPIGLDISARTPAEIAICILAEMINVLRGGPAVSLADKRRDRRERRATSLN